MALDWTQYIGNPVYQTIASRLYERHNIRIADQIDSMSRIGARNGIGFHFVAKNPESLRLIFKQSPGFAHDNRQHFCDQAAALATNGEGFREIGVPSLHCAVAKSICSIHLDSFGFVARGPDGKKYYNPDLIQHIIDELGWASFVQWVESKSRPLGGFLARIHPVLPNSRNRYNLSIDPRKRNPLTLGGQLDVIERNTWRLSIEGRVDNEREWSAGVTLSSRPF